MSTVVADIEREYLRDDLPEFRPGDTVVVNVRIKEGEKERIQAYEGVVLRKRGGGTRASFTVRKVSYGTGVERIFPLHSPSIASIKVKTEGRARRARLYFLRALKGKAAKQMIKKRR